LIDLSFDECWQEKMVPNNLIIHAMNTRDLTFATECTAMEGWVSEDRTMLEGFFFHDPGGCLVVELEGRQVGIGVATSYGHCGFIGELIVRPEARGQGIGAALLNHGVAYLQKRGARTVYLDGVVKAVDLYERNGFRKICRSLRFSGEVVGKSHSGVCPMLEKDLPIIFDLDGQYFGADRSFFLRRRWTLFPELSKVLAEDGQVKGYIFGRKGEGWVAAGPWVVKPEVKHPQQLLEALAVAIGGQMFSIGILESNLRAIEIIRSYGFIERSDSPWRMALGEEESLGASPQCLAVGTAAKG
jgi:GNAT superfamily N-acetyltransferase